MEDERVKRMPPEWFIGLNRMDADQVKKMDSGSTVFLVGADRHGEKTMLECTVIYSGIHKVLSYRDGYGYRQTKPIRKYAGKVYAVKGE